MTNISSGFLMGLDVIRQRRFSNKVTSLLLFSDGQNSFGDPTESCLSALRETGTGRVTVCTFGYGEKLDSRFLEALANHSGGTFYPVESVQDIDRVFGYALGSLVSVVARNLQVNLTLKGGKVPCELTKVYSKDGLNSFHLPTLSANEVKNLIFLLKPIPKDLTGSVKCSAVEVTITYIDSEGAESEESATLVVKFVPYEGPMASQDPSVFKHWFRVRGAEYVGKARELATQQQFPAAKDLLDRGIEALQASGYTHCPVVAGVLGDLVKARDLVESDQTWERGGDQHFASVSYSHFSQAASAFTPYYASPQQSLQLATNDFIAERFELYREVEYALRTHFTALGRSRSPLQMDGYQLGEVLAFDPSSFVTLYRATSVTNLPVIAKKHEYRSVDQKETQAQITFCINAALRQAKVQHPHTCDILEVQFTMQDSHCEIYHILESMDTSVGRDIAAGETTYTEPELRNFLKQTASALAFAHDQNIAHRDVKPDNVFRTGNTYKVGDFDCVFTKRDITYTRGHAGDTRYMSPQLREACIRCTPYNPFKADVFALAASLLHMATLISPEDLLRSKGLDVAVRSHVETLAFSEQLQTLLISMLSYEESRRPTMKDVLSTLSQETPPLPFSLFATVYQKKVELYDLQSQQSTQHTLFVNFGDGGSHIQVDTHTLLCLGGSPPSTGVYGLDLPSATLTPLPPLSTPRRAAGVAKAVHTVFVFGGCDASGSLKSCEKYGLEDRQWLPLGDMYEGRGWFTPCTFRTLIYLPCPWTTRTIETFHPVTEIFTVLPVSLPAALRGYASVSFVANGELCVLTANKQMGMWQVESKRKCSLIDTNRECFSNQSPLIVDSLVLIANYSNYGRVDKFSLESYTFI